MRVRERRSDFHARIAKSGLQRRDEFLLERVEPSDGAEDQRTFEGLKEMRPARAVAVQQLEDGRIDVARIRDPGVAAQTAVVPVEEPELAQFPGGGFPGHKPFVDLPGVVAERGEGFDEGVERFRQGGRREGSEMSRAAEFLFRLFGRARDDDAPADVGELRVLQEAGLPRGLRAYFADAGHRDVPGGIHEFVCEDLAADELPAREFRDEYNEIGAVHAGVKALSRSGSRTWRRRWPGRH